MKNRHAIIDPVSGLVRNIVVWEGAAWLPPKGHYVVNDAVGQIGDYWHQESNSFYTIENKKRILSHDNKVGVVELSDEEKKSLEPILERVFAQQRKVRDITLASQEQ